MATRRPANSVNPLRRIPPPDPKDTIPVIRKTDEQLHREKRISTREKKYKELMEKRGKLRKYVTLSKTVAHDLLRAYKSWEETGDEYPAVFLIGENGKQVIKDIERLGNLNSGCGEMPSITSTEISNAYVRLARRGLTGCAIARVGEGFDNDNTWGSDSGYAIYTKNLKYILSYDGRRFTAVTLVDPEIDIYDDDYYKRNKNEDDDYDYDDENGFNKNFVELEVKMGK